MSYEQDYALELQYFHETEKHIEKQLESALKDSEQTNKALIDSRKDMWENASHSALEFDRVLEISQYLTPMAGETYSASTSQNRVDSLIRMADSPYFARIDFRYDGEREPEAFYIGRFSLIDEKMLIPYVYDWRAPISSLFYRHGVGRAFYDAPGGRMEGELTLKRQYEIRNGQFDYFFDADVQIVDEFLRKMLAKNASTKMKTIVETIQKEQDEVIRDSKNQLLMVQGVAGSGKTSIALHRVAYLMYEGLSRKLNANNIIIISPNTLFEQYISEVLPELGERDVTSVVFTDLINAVLGAGDIVVQSRHDELEAIIDCDDPESKALKKAAIQFKASAEFVEILKRYANDVARKWIPFHDVVYCGQTVFTGGELQKMLHAMSNNGLLAANLYKVEKAILEVIHKLQKTRLLELEKEANSQTEHMYDWKEYARMLSIEESTVLIKDIRMFTRLDYLGLYRNLFKSREYFDSLTQGIVLPELFDEIFDMTKESVQKSSLEHQDAAALTLLKLLLAPFTAYRDIKQIVVDEAQDYDCIHFDILNRLFSRSSYTILGDVNQTIEKRADQSLYTKIQDILQKENAYLAMLNQSFRSTNEILRFSSRFISLDTPVESVGRSGEVPIITGASDNDQYLAAIEKEIGVCKECGYESVGLICKSRHDAENLYQQLSGKIDMRLLTGDSGYNTRGVFIIPVYMAKGLEFDAALVCDVDEEHYKSEDDSHLLYVACTRALHRLNLFYFGDPSRLLEEGRNDY